jgi:O-acetyl-ADP-ribose deacetylase (regulator of RNase III)
MVTSRANAWMPSSRRRTSRCSVVGGVDGAVHRAAGPRLAEAGGVIGPCEPGDAMPTPAFDLDPPVRHVIHTVGPVWEGGGYDEADILASCYRRSLEVADELGVRTPFRQSPPVSTGSRRTRPPELRSTSSGLPGPESGE